MVRGSASCGILPWLPREGTRAGYRKGVSHHAAKILLGKSLSGLFAIYVLLARPTAFNAYIGCSAGWFAENIEYFGALRSRAFQNSASYGGRRVFMANSLQDQYDPDQAIHRQMVEFTALVKEKLGQAISYQYKTYDDYPHVPFPCLYDGLRFVTDRSTS